MRNAGRFELATMAATLAAGLAMSATGTSAVAQGADEPIVATGPVSELHGSMMGHVAGEDHPVLLIIPGSGPTDRDGNSPLGITAGTYRLLASDLAAQITGTTLRIDGGVHSHYWR